MAPLFINCDPKRNLLSGAGVCYTSNTVAHAHLFFYGEISFNKTAATLTVVENVGQSRNNILEHNRLILRLYNKRMKKGVLTYVFYFSVEIFFLNWI